MFVQSGRAANNNKGVQITCVIACVSGSLCTVYKFRKCQDPLDLSTFCFLMFGFIISVSSVTLNVSHYDYSIEFFLGFIS